jgi:mannosyl-oligosaccharide alpha-1,2-mannosidase
MINLAEFGTYSMEFTRLSQVTGNPKYEQLATDLINAAIQQPTRMPGLFPTSWTVKPFAPVNSSKRLGLECKKEHCWLNYKLA